MIFLPIKARVLLGLYLLIVATLAVGIHIQMTNAGIRYPQWFDQPIWVPLSLFILQNMGILWLSERMENVVKFHRSMGCILYYDGCFTRAIHTFAVNSGLHR